MATNNLPAMPSMTVSQPLIMGSIEPLIFLLVPVQWYPTSVLGYHGYSLLAHRQCLCMPPSDIMD
jgi:hypothetical protein